MSAASDLETADLAIKKLKVNSPNICFDISLIYVQTLTDGPDGDSERVTKLFRYL